MGIATTRRSALSHIGLASAATAAVAQVPAGAAVPEDPHVGWRAEERQLHDAMTRAYAVDDETLAEALNAQRWEVRGRILETPAATPAGLAIRVRTIAEMDAEGLTLDEDDFAALLDVAETLERMGGRV